MRSRVEEEPGLGEVKRRRRGEERRRGGDWGGED